MSARPTPATPEQPAPAPTRPQDIKVVSPGRKLEPARDADSDVLSPPDSAGGR